VANPFFTIAICTCNRAAVLPYAVHAALGQDFPPERHEILIVDNNSTDETPRVAGDLAAAHPRIRCVKETSQGLSFARNRAFREAKGEVIVYVDDDAQMCPDYLANLEKVFQEEAGIGAAGGPIEVGWLGPVPSWYEPDLDYSFNYLYIASFRTRVVYPRMIYGTNMAFPVSVLRKIGGFQTGLGRIGSRLLAGEDVEIALRIERKEKLSIFYSIIQNFIPNDGIRKRFFEKRYFQK